MSCRQLTIISVDIHCHTCLLRYDEHHKGSHSSRVDSHIRTKGDAQRFLLDMPWHGMAKRYGLRYNVICSGVCLQPNWEVLEPLGHGNVSRCKRHCLHRAYNQSYLRHHRLDSSSESNMGPSSILEKEDGHFRTVCSWNIVRYDPPPNPTHPPFAMDFSLL